MIIMKFTEFLSYNMKCTHPNRDHGINEQNSNDPVSSKMYKLASAPIEDSDQPALLRILIRVFDRRSRGSKVSKIWSDGKLRLRSDCHM